VGGRVTPVEEGVDRDPWHALAVGEVDEGEEVAVDGVDASVPEQAAEVESGVSLADRTAEAYERLVAEEVAGLDRAVDADEVLGEHASGTEGGVAHLAISHLSVRESNGEAGRVEQGVGGSRPEAVPGGEAGEGYGVSLALPAIAPAVEHHEDDRSGG
jgi:hypothetical protein